MRRSYLGLWVRQIDELRRRIKRRWNNAAACGRLAGWRPHLVRSLRSPGREAGTRRTRTSTAQDHRCRDLHCCRSRIPIPRPPAWCERRVGLRPHSHRSTISTLTTRGSHGTRCPSWLTPHRYRQRLAPSPWPPRPHGSHSGYVVPCTCITRRRGPADPTAAPAAAGTQDLALPLRMAGGQVLTPATTTTARRATRTRPGASGGP